jgi:hypothetical protein
MLFKKPLYEWRKPKPLKSKLSEVFFPQMKFILRGYLVAMVFAVLIYAYLKSISTGQFDEMWDNIFLKFIPGSFGIIVLIVVGGAIQCAFDFATYQLSERGVRSSDSPHWFLQWSKIQGFWIEPSEKHEEIYFTVFLAGKRRRRIPLPQDKELCEHILQTLSQRIPKIQPVDEPPRYSLSDLQWIFMALFTLVYSYTLAYICLPYVSIINRERAEWLYLLVMLLLCILGPGTFGLAILVKGRWSEFKNRIHSVLIFNFMAFNLFIFLLVLMDLRFWLELAGK